MDGFLVEVIGNLLYALTFIVLMVKKWLLGIIIFILLIIILGFTLSLFQPVDETKITCEYPRERTYQTANSTLPKVKINYITKPENYNIEAFVINKESCPEGYQCDLCQPGINGIVISDMKFTYPLYEEDFEYLMFHSNKTIILSDLSNPSQFEVDKKYLFTISVIEIGDHSYQDKSTILTTKNKIKEAKLLGYSEIEQ